MILIVSSTAIIYNVTTNHYIRRSEALGFVESAETSVLHTSTFALEWVFVRTSNKLIRRWQTYGCKFENWDDMFASAAKQFVCKYLSYFQNRQEKVCEYFSVHRDHVDLNVTEILIKFSFTLILNKLYWMVRAVIKITMPPKEISVITRSVYHGIPLNIWNENIRTE